MAAIVGDVTGRRAAIGILAGIVAPIAAWALTVVVGAAWPGYDPIARSISVLADAPLGWLQTLAFAISGVFGAVWAFGLSSVLGATPRERSIVRALLLVQALIAFGFAILPADLGPERAPVSIVGTLHLANFYLYAVTMPPTLLAFGLVMRRDPRWRGSVRPTFLAAAVVLVSIALVPATLDGPLTPWLGLLERVFVAVPSIWQVGAGIVAWRILRARRVVSTQLVVP
jgi:hypothetical membrane protein